MQELDQMEIAEVSGGSLAGDVGAFLGTIFGSGAAMQKAIDETGNGMLSAMQYGA